ncbi:MAG: phosphoribosyltransferase family protein [Deinococcales bacterium]|jgi:ComF family protein
MIRAVVAAVVAAVLGALLPCPACGVRPAGVRGCCPRCRRRAPRPGRNAQALWLGPYTGPLGRTVRALKYRSAGRLATWLGEALAAEVAASGWHPTLACGVPLHASRRRQRGYDQAALLAARTARVLGVPYRPVLRRIRPTRPQARLGRRERRTNVAGAFESEPVTGASVLLIDDVLTTGATAAACSEALLAAGAREVRIAVVARSDRAAPAAASAEPPSDASDGRALRRPEAAEGVRARPAERW